MHKPETIEKLYLDFDGFFAGMMQQAMFISEPPLMRNCASKDQAPSR